MIVRYRNISRAVLVVSWLAMGSVAVQAEHPSLNQPANSTAPTPSAAPQTPAAQPPSQSAAPQVDTAEIIRRINQEVGFDIQVTITDWKGELD